MSSTLTYVYCLVRSARRPSLQGVPDGMPGGREVRVLDLPPLGPASRRAPRHWLIVSSVPERVYGESALQRGLQRLQWVGPRAIAHEAVVEHFLTSAAVLPMQLFTLFMGDARAIEHVVGDGRRIAGILSRIERQHEWGLRLTWDPGAALKEVDRAHAARPHQSAPEASEGGKARGRKMPSGADYLARKRDVLDVTRVRLKRARVDADRLYRAVSREASDARRRTAIEQAAPGSRLLLDAAFLVPARRTGAFRAAVRRSARTLKGSGIAVSLTGPWPAYNFI